MITFFPYGGNCRWGPRHRVALFESQYVLKGRTVYRRGGYYQGHICETSHRYVPKTREWIKSRFVFYAWSATMNTEEDAIRIAEIAAEKSKSHRFLIQLALMAEEHFQ